MVDKSSGVRVKPNGQALPTIESQPVENCCSPRWSKFWSAIRAGMPS